MSKRQGRFRLHTTVLAAFLLAVSTSGAWGENHDLVLQDAPDVTSAIPANWKSPDIKIGADFGDASVPDIIRRGLENPVYPRFYINGIQDYTVPSGGMEIRLHFREATLGDTPPAITDTSWQAIGTIPVTYAPTDGPFAITRTWPADFPSVPTKSVSWDVPDAAGPYFHIRSEVLYLPATGVTDEVSANNVAVSLYDSISGLVDLVLVHDTSGSMNYYKFDGLPYIQHAKARASTFIPAINDSSRFAIVEFNGNLPTGYNDVWPSPASLQLATVTNKNNAITAVAGLSAGGSTPMGAGLQRAIDLLLGAPDDGVTRKKVILLLSDGYENSGTLRACSGANPAAPCVGSSLLTQLQSNNIRVFSMALGTASWTQCLECLATQSDGYWYGTPDPGINMEEVYLQIQDDYTSDDLYRMDRGVSGGGDDSYSTYFEAVDDVLYFILAWNDLEASLNLQLRAPDGSWSDPATMPNATVFAGNGYNVVRVARAQQGTWEYRVLGDNGEEYLAAVRSARTGVRLALEAYSDGRVGNAIDIRARLTRNGQPLTEAKLNATIHIPDGGSLDTTLRGLARDYILKNKSLPLNPADLKQNPDIWPRAAFIGKISDGKPESLIRTRPVSVSLSHVGDGVYAGTMKEMTQVAGIYKVNVNYHNEGIDRTQTRQVVLKPGEIAPAASRAEIVEIKAQSGAPQWLLRIYPVDRFDNAVADPRLLTQIETSVEGGHVDKTPSIAFDSALQQTVIPAPGKTPKLTKVAVNGQELEIIDSEQPDGSDRGNLIIIIALLIAALLLFWFWRLQQNKT